ncbi:thioredoxin domain-containing protein 10 [Paragonimus westermani]|uniref:Thioredoxin domain-containing protein 10 n=1 Tax=Paragonimus westermani TaxID=34504 RepID=A0A5J4NE12_9TREM|nr:thioredoxin domain-containing protein 10 [Paragonimus westermani]
MTFRHLLGVRIPRVVFVVGPVEAKSRVCMSRQLSLVLFLYLIPTYSSRVVELNESFLQIVHDGPWLFYATWCGYCRRLAPTYEDVSDRLAELGSPIKVGRLDASSHRGLGKHFSVTGFPTIKFIDREVIVQYDGDRSTRNIVSFALRAHGSAVKVVTSRADLERNVTFFGSDPFYVLINPRDSALMRLAKLLKSENGTKNEVVVFKDSDVLVYPHHEGNGRPQHLFSWILRERYPVFGRLELSDLWEFGISELSVSDASTEATTTVSESTPKHPLYRLVALFLVRIPHTDEPVVTRYLDHFPFEMCIMLFAFVSHQFHLFSGISFPPTSHPDV